jgi:hypothetical protein
MNGHISLLYYVTICFVLAFLWTFRKAGGGFEARQGPAPPFPVKRPSTFLGLLRGLAGDRPRDADLRRRLPRRTQPFDTID